MSAIINKVIIIIIIWSFIILWHTTATFRFLQLTLLGDSHMKSIEIAIREKKELNPQKDRHISGFIWPLKDTKHPHSMVLICIFCAQHILIKEVLTVVGCIGCGLFILL